MHGAGCAGRGGDRAGTVDRGGDGSTRGLGGARSAQARGQRVCAGEEAGGEHVGTVGVRGRGESVAMADQTHEMND